MRIAIVDDHPAICEGFASYVSDCAPTATVESHTSLAAALSNMRHDMPDIVLADVFLAEGTTFDAMHELLRISPALRVVFMSAQISRGSVRHALEKGAVGFISKFITRDDFSKMLQAVSSGTPFYDAHVLNALNLSEADVPRLPSLLAQAITPRETQVLRLVARGLSSRAIAIELGLSVRTVDRHRSNIMDKLGLHDKVQLTRHAIREGLIQV